MTKDVNYKLRVMRGTKITVKMKDLPIKSSVLVDTKCDNCGKITQNRYVDYLNQVKPNNKTYCKHCCRILYGGENGRITSLKNGISFEQWCIDNNRQDILDRWDYKLNKYKPSEIGKNSTIKIWFKCPINKHPSELKCISNFTNGSDGSLNCLACNSIRQWLINKYGKNALKEYWSDKNKSNPFIVSYGSTEKIYIICQICKNAKLISPNTYIKYGLACNKCSDGVSYPNKIAFNLLEQLGLDFIPKYCPDWIKPKRYDFYFELNNKKYILEMDGGLGHGNRSFNKSGIESKNEDDYKDKMALIHGIEIIRIDSKLSDIEYIKTNIINSKLNTLFDLQKIHWNKCHKYACNSLVKMANELWNSGIHNTLEISKNLNLSRITIQHYLKKGSKCGLSDYDPIIEKSKCVMNEPIKIFCIELNRIFNSTKDIERELKIGHSNISAVCRGRSKSAGGYHWMYYEDWLKLHNNEIAS